MHTPTAGTGFDNRALDELRGEAARNPRGAARQAAVQFETLFTQMMLKSMRDATPKAEEANFAADNFTSMLDSQLAKQFAGRPGGLADVIEKQLTRHMQNLPSTRSPAEPPAPPVAWTAPAAAASTVTTFAAPPAASLAATTAAIPAATPRSAPVAARAAMPAATAAGAPSSSLRTSRQAEFVRKMLPHAQEAQRRTGVPADFILGQAALESGWGKGEIRNADGSTSFNVFGIKATPKWRGATADVPTTEFVGGVAQRMRAKFRSYESYAEAFTDYARMISTQRRYAGVVAQSSTPEAFATGMQRAGYATDPQYASKLARTINHALSIQRAMV